MLKSLWMLEEKKMLREKEATKKEATKKKATKKETTIKQFWERPFLPMISMRVRLDFVLLLDMLINIYLIYMIHNCFLKGLVDWSL